MEITYEEFRKVHIRVGTVLSVKKNEKSRQSALVLEVDFGKEIGVKTTSAKITYYYNPENLIGRQVIAVCNFPTKNIAGIVSEVLILFVLFATRLIIFETCNATIFRRFHR